MLADMLADMLRSVGATPCTRRVIRATIFTSAAIALWSNEIAAQDSTLVEGSHIRIQSADETRSHEGTFRAFTADSIRFSPGLDTATETLPLSRVGRIEVLRYRSGAGSVLKDAAIGSGVGLGATLAFAGGCALTKHDCSLGALFISPLMIGTGFLVGALIGADARSEHWSRVYPSARRASLLIGPMSHGGFALGLSVPFGSAPGS
jgi:hypothetical protein